MTQKLANLYQLYHLDIAETIISNSDTNLLKPDQAVPNLEYLLISLYHVLHLDV